MMVDGFTRIQITYKTYCIVLSMLSFDLYLNEFWDSRKMVENFERPLHVFHGHLLFALTLPALLLRTVLFRRKGIGKYFFFRGRDLFICFWTAVAKGAAVLEKYENQLNVIGGACAIVCFGAARNRWLSCHIEASR